MTMVWYLSQSANLSTETYICYYILMDIENKLMFHINCVLIKMSAQLSAMQKKIDLTVAICWKTPSA